MWFGSLGSGRIVGSAPPSAEGEPTSIRRTAVPSARRPGGRSLDASVRRRAPPDRRRFDADPTTPALTCDVLVVGAGPAGTAAAIELTRGGSHVVVVDKAMFPRDKCCGDGLTTLALRGTRALGSRSVDRGRLARRVGRVAAFAVGSRGRAAAPDRRQVRGGRAPARARRRAGRASPGGRASTSATAARSSGHARRRPGTANGDAATGDRSCRDRRRRHRSGPLRRRRRRHVEPGAQGARRQPARLPRRMARVPPVRERRHRARRRPAVRVVRGRSAARLRVVVPAARQPGERRVRRAARAAAAGSAT